MKQIPARAVKEICAAQQALEACLQVPTNAPYHISMALKHVSEAAQHIVALQLAEKLQAQKGAKR